MSQLPAQIGRVIAPPPAGATAPGRVVERVEERELGGRVIQIVYVLRTHVTPERTYETIELVRGVTCSCSCQAASLADVFCCNACRAITCPRHTLTCAQCGLVHCSACAVGLVEGNARAIVCRACARAMRAPRIVKLARALSCWLWE